MPAVTSQPLPFDRLEREKHIQVIFSAFQNRCGPSCQCHKESDEQLSGLTPGRETENMHPPGKVKRPGVEEQWPGGAAGSHFMSVLETVSQIHVTARPELQGEQEGLCICVFLWGRLVWFKEMMLCCCRSTVCSQEDLQHHRRRQQITVNCGRGRYRSPFSYMRPNWAHSSFLRLMTVNVAVFPCSLPSVREFLRVSPVLWSGSGLFPAGLRLSGPPGLLFWKAPQGGRLLPRLLPDGDEGVHTSETSYWQRLPEVQSESVSTGSLWL